MLKIYIILALLSIADVIFLKNNKIGKIINIVILAASVFTVFYWRVSIWHLFGFAIVWLLASYAGGYINGKIKSK